MEGRHQQNHELTPRQREVLALMARGMTNFEIATQLGLSLEGAKYHVSEILARFDVATREEAIDVWKAERNLGNRLRRNLATLGSPTAWRWLAGSATAVAAVVTLVLLMRQGGNDAPVSTADPLGAVVATIPVAEQPDSIAVGEGGVWVGHHTARVVTRIDPATNTVIGTIPLDSRWIQVTTAFGSVWALGSESATVHRIEPLTNTIVATVPLYDADVGATSGMQIAASNSAIWVKDDRNMVFRIDPATNQITLRLAIDNPSNLEDISIFDEDVWVSTGLGELVRIDATDSSLHRNVFTLPRAGKIAASAAGLWVTIGDRHVIGRINPLTGGFEEIAKLSQPGKPLVAFGSVWELQAGSGSWPGSQWGAVQARRSER
jgi:DNA-binding CsgD family transcriptional regulator/streptogramin lyase